MDVEVTHIVSLLDNLNDGPVSLVQLVLGILRSPATEIAEHPIVVDTITRIGDILDTLAASSLTRETALSWCRKRTSHQISQEVLQLVRQPDGYRFGASTATAERLQNIKYETMVEDMQKTAPTLWELLSFTLLADPDIGEQQRYWRGQYTRRKGRKARAWGAYSDGEDVVMADLANPGVHEEEDIWEDMPDDFLLEDDHETNMARKDLEESKRDDEDGFGVDDDEAQVDYALERHTASVTMVSASYVVFPSTYTLE